MNQQGFRGSEAPDIELAASTKGYAKVSSVVEASHATPSSFSHTPHDICWADLNFNVGTKSILTNCFGSVPAGKVCAVIGPSGAGKSSLLNVLAGRSASCHGITVTGTIAVSGKRIDPVKYRRNIAYVMQDDSLMPTATPREALRFSAYLRLPAGTDAHEIDRLVTECLIDLGIEGCADTLIGGGMIKGISGGQRKRTSVGVEIVTNPSLLFLDEPTSGLDSFSASNMIKLLKNIAAKGAVVLCTIHQPSSAVFVEFDLCIFMREGRIFYQGPAALTAKFFSDFSFECPPNFNPSDFVMLVLQTVSSEKLVESGLEQANAVAALEYRAMLSGIEEHDHLQAGESQETIVSAVAPFGSQLKALSQREMTRIRRDVGALRARFGVTIILNTLFGLIFFGAGGESNAVPANLSSHFGAVMMVTIASMFNAAQPVMLAFPFERPLFMREYSTGTYGGIAYFLSKAILELPLTFVQALLQYTICYFLCDFQGVFIFEVLAAWGLGIASSSIAVLLGCTRNDVRDVTELAPIVFVPQLLFAGFFIRTAKIPVFLRWAQYLCSVKYAINLILITEFDPTNASCQGASAQQCASILTNNDIDASQWWVYALILFALFLVFRIIAAVVLVRRAQKYY